MSKQELLQLSVCDICNLDCIFCSQHETLYGVEKKGIRPKSRMMNVDDLSEFLDNFKGKKFKTLSLVSSGEFFVHPAWDDILEKVLYFVHTERPADILVINTNGTLLTTSRIDHIFLLLKKYPVKFKFVFSINASNPETYKRITGKDLYPDVLLSSGYFLKRTFEHNKKDDMEDVYFSAQFLVVKENKDDLKDFIDMWRQRFDDIKVRHELKLYCEPVEEKYSIVIRKAFLPKQKESDELFISTLGELGIEIPENCDVNKEAIDLSGDDASLVSRFKPPCIALWKYPYISTDGKVTICCRDVSFKYSYGNIEGGKSIGEIMQKSPELKNFREIHVQGRWEKMPLCYRCSGYETSNSDEATWKQLLERTDPDLWFDYKARMKTGDIFDYYFAKAQNNISILKDHLDYTDRRVDKLEYADSKVDRSFFRDTTKNIRYSHKDINPSYPCSYWFRVLKEKDGDLSTGCDRADIPVAISEGFKEELLNGNVGLLPFECRICKERPHIKEIDILNICPHRFDEFSLFIGEKKVKDVKEVIEKNASILEFLKKNKNRKLNEYLWEKVFDEKKVKELPFDFLCEYFKDDTSGLYSLLMLYPNKDIKLLEKTVNRLRTPESYFKLMRAFLYERDYEKFFSYLDRIDIRILEDFENYHFDKLLLICSTQLADDFRTGRLVYLMRKYKEYFDFPEKIFSNFYKAVIDQKLSLVFFIDFVQEFYPLRLEDIFSYLAVDITDVGFSERVCFLKKYKDSSYIDKHINSYTHTMFLNHLYYSLYVLMQERALDYSERANDDRFFKIIKALYLKKDDIEIINYGWRTAQENNCMKAALSLYTIAYKNDPYSYLDKYRFMLYFLEENERFSEAFRVNLKTMFRYPMFFIKKSINLVMYMTGIKRRRKE